MWLSEFKCVPCGGAHRWLGMWGVCWAPVLKAGCMSEAHSFLLFLLMWP